MKIVPFYLTFILLTLNPTLISPTVRPFLVLKARAYFYKLLINCFDRHSKAQHSTLKTNFEGISLFHHEERKRQNTCWARYLSPCYFLFMTVRGIYTAPGSRILKAKLNWDNVHRFLKLPLYVIDNRKSHMQPPYHHYSHHHGTGKVKRVTWREGLVIWMRWDMESWGTVETPGSIGKTSVGRSRVSFKSPRDFSTMGWERRGIFYLRPFLNHP